MICGTLSTRTIALLLLMIGVSSGCSAALLDTDVITSGRIPSDIKFDMVKPNKAELRVIREYAPCLKLDLRGNGKWNLTFGVAGAVIPGQTYTLAVSLASAGEAGQSKTQDIANFRPENQAKKIESLEGKGYATLVVLGDGKLLSSVSVSPTSWVKLTTEFKVPSGVRTISARLSGDGGGVFFIADMDVAEGSVAPSVYVPAALTLSQIQGGEQVIFSTLIKEGQPYSLYKPGETITWKVESPSDEAYKMFYYKITDAYGSSYAGGYQPFPNAVSYKPSFPGYYELVIKSISTKDSSSVLFDRLGASVLNKVMDFEAGGNAFGVQCAPMDLAKSLGATWARGGIALGWMTDVNQVDANTDYSKNIASFEDNHIMPLHSSNSITCKTNSEVIGSENFLPTDMQGYSESYKKLAEFGNRYVKTFEFWNEPEGRIGATAYWTAQNFTDALTAAHKGMKEASPDAKMAVGSNIDLVKAVNACGGQDSYEILILHPYPWAVGGPWNTPEDGLVLETCISARKWLDSCGGKNKEIWSTEYGYTTGTTICGCSELQQAQMDVRASLLQLAGGLNKINPFRMDDVYFWGQVDGRFGLCRGNQTPKPSFVGYGVLIRAVRDLPYRGRFSLGKNLAVLVFGNDKETCIAFWTDKGEKIASLKLTAKCRLMDMFGATRGVAPGLQRFTASTSVSYLLVPQGYKKFVGSQKAPFVAGLSGGIFEGNTHHKEWKIPMLTKVPIVDGMLDEWSGPAIKFDEPSQNLNAQIRFAFAAGNLYLMGSIRGDSPGTNKNDNGKLWDGDCIELYFTPKPNDRCVGFYRDVDFHLLVAPGVDGSIGKAANGLSGTNPEIPGSRVRYTRNPQGGYDIEASLPLSFIKVSDVKRGQRFGLDVQVSIGSSTGDSRRLQVTWSGSGQNYMSPYLWGEAVASPAQ